MKRTPLHRYTPLKTHTPLKAYKGLNRMSDKTKQELKVWRIVKNERIQKLIDKFGYLPCEYCLKVINNVSETDAHHNSHDRRKNVFSECRITHSYCNRILIEDNNVKDVPSLL
jgi:hypothetical protein